MFDYKFFLQLLKAQFYFLLRDTKMRFTDHPMSIYMHFRLLEGFPGGSDCKESSCNAGDVGLLPGSGRCLEKRMDTHSRILAWKIPGTEEPGGIPSTGSQNQTRLRH